MPLLQANKESLHDQHQTISNNISKKRRRSNDQNLTPLDYPEPKRLAEDMDAQKSNFSSVSSPSNGFTKPSGAIASKTGAKKLVIKNFKGRLQ